MLKIYDRFKNQTSRIVSDFGFRKVRPDLLILFINLVKSFNV